MPDAFSTVQDLSNSAVLDYTSRDFTAIRSQLVGLAKGIMPDWQTAGEPSDFGTLLLELFAYMGDVMHFYIDRTASEAFLGTALRRQSVLYIADMLGYTPIGQQSAIVRWNFSIDPARKESLTLPAGTRIHNDASSASELIVFELDADVFLDPIDHEPTGPAPILTAPGYGTEGIMHYDRLLGVSAGSPNTEFIVPDKGVVNGTMTMQSREGPTVVEWSHVSNIALARPTQSVFTSFIDESEYTHILFGDQAAGRIPPVNAEIFLTYRTGVGVEANALAPDSLIVVKPEDTSLDLWGLTVKHPASPVGGTDPESIDAMRYSIPRAATRLKSRAITLNDYADLAMQVPGVAKSVASGTVYTSVHVHIAPTGGTGTDELMTQLCDNVERYLSDKIIVGSAVQAEPRPLSPDPDIEDAMPQLWQDVFVRVMVHVQESYSRTTVRRNVVAVLRQMLDFNNVDFGTRVSIGAIYRVGLAVQGVEWLDLFWLHTAAPTPSDLASGVWTDVGPHTVADIEPLETLIPKIDDVEVIETVANWPGFTDEELTHDGLWVQAVGGLPGS